MKRRMNDGNSSGIKQDKFRHSRFEMNERPSPAPFQGVSRATINTLGGSFDENRGHRLADETTRDRGENPFENGKLHNWNKRQGWDEHFNGQWDKGNHGRGGALRGQELGFKGLGPRGYKRDDQQVYEDVCETLWLSPNVDATAIEVSVQEGCVYLKGSVEDRETKRMAEFEIENISGVLDVQNMLVLKKNDNLAS